MTEEQKKPAAAQSPTDAAVVQIREVTKWLIGGFAAVGVALAAGSQLSEIGHLEDGRLVAAGIGVGLTLVGIVVAIVYATKVMTPRPVGLDELVAGESASATGKRIKEEPDLLMGYGTSIAEFQEKRREAIAEAEKAWERYEGSEDDEKLRAQAMRTQEDKARINAAMQWLFSFARYTETERLFKRSLRVMMAAAAIAALGIVTFAWAAHPEAEEAKASAPAVVAQAPALVEVDLGPEGIEAYADDLGGKCDLDALKAIAVGGSAEAPEVVTVPTEACELDRFVLNDEVGTYRSLEPLTRPDEVPPHG
ncbi:MAG TPA: hypothetical protein VFZ19_03020 [Solirubrobacterales bacterium]